MWKDSRGISPERGLYGAQLGTEDGLCVPHALLCLASLLLKANGRFCVLTPLKEGICLRVGQTSRADILFGAAGAGDDICAAGMACRARPCPCSAASVCSGVAADARHSFLSGQSGARRSAHPLCPNCTPLRENKTQGKYLFGHCMHREYCTAFKVH